MTRLAIALLLFVVLVAGGAMAVAEPPRSQRAQSAPTIALPSDWPVGAVYRIEMIKERERYKGAELQSQESIRREIDLEILQKSDRGYVMAWINGPVQIRGGAGADGSLTQRMQRIQDYLRIEFATDPDGNVEELRNADEVMYRVEQAASLLLDSLRESGMTEEQLVPVDQFLAPMRQADIMGPIVLQEPKIFLLPTGGEYTLGQAIRYSDHLPNPFGGRPFPSEAAFLLEDLDQSAGSMRLSWVQSLDPVAARQILMETFTEIASQSGQPKPSPRQLPSVTIEDQADYLFNLDSGLPATVAHKRRITIGDGQQIDRLSFRLIDGK